MNNEYQCVSNVRMKWRLYLPSEQQNVNVECNNVS